jgi:hypothetical protein
MGSPSFQKWKPAYAEENPLPTVRRSSTLDSATRPIGQVLPIAANGGSTQLTKPLVAKEWREVDYCTMNAKLIVWLFSPDGAALMVTV